MSIFSKILKHNEKVGRFVYKHSDSILTGLAGVGVVATAVLSFNCAKELEALKHKAITPNRKKEYNIAVAKAVAKPVISGVLTIGCIILARKIMVDKWKALTIALALKDTKLSDLKEEVKKLGITTEKEKNRVETVKEDGGSSFGKSIVAVDSDKMYKVRDLVTGCEFRASICEIREAVNRVNHRMTCGNEYYCSINEFYDELDIPNTVAGNLLGFSTTKGLLRVDIDSDIKPNGEVELTIEYDAYQDYRE